MFSPVEDAGVLIPAEAQSGSAGRSVVFDRRRAMTDILYIAGGLVVFGLFAAYAAFLNRI
jgi:hypothetical protein